MSANSSFEPGGGWQTGERMIRVWTRRLWLTTLCWLPVALIAICWAWTKPLGSETSIAELVSIIALSVQVALFAVTCIVRVRERPSRVAVMIPNPHRDFRKLY